MNDKLLKKLEKIYERHHELEKLLSDPEVIADAGRYTAYIKEHGSLSKMVNKYTQLTETLVRKKETEGFLAQEGEDKELAKMARDELGYLEKQEESLFEEIKGLFVTEDKISGKNVIAEIRAGTGGDEAAIFAADLFRMYTKYAENQGWKVELFDSSETDLGGFREVTFSIEGNNVYQKLRFESGTHRVQRVPRTEASGRVHTSTATVAILPEIEEVEIDINPNDILVDTFRASGPGGQKVNKTSSAVRITHVPSGLVVKCLDEKSQHKNRAKAMRILRSRLYELYEGQKRNERDQIRRDQIGTGDRSEKIRTYNYPQNRVTDHRINFSVHNLEQVMLGSLDEIVETLLTYYKEEQLKQLAASL
ncbi:MAG: peptide chain release factor 1 [Candidatus Brocadia sp.]|jgi:bacterial peptide chain release factor 1 (bRF-1)|uniref:Peptide chain release factor 1 n=1 Tax=Candidatus Brocadia fulgida TaxID=380242 RepID=A0A0M2UR16_9BACT|nr:MAG: peptide chain release factor [Candidatus Brocadia fulgida]MCC6324893.1 peptide chain release factor 1 [Candidatus Brocadia sp.]MCE7910169.1 peptide chain release factor 1 [Candidatus Brocadia sp. AMX3]OQZ01594.1 MAG: peptide chain release factor 1 [Candidatus Brocadia sp. UTAMX2]MBV6518350.1 Peptide chain release factor RF1 [Candidatus Brocadia fulgida]